MGEIAPKAGLRRSWAGARWPPASGWSLRRLADVAQVPKDFVYRLDAGQARYVELDALARLCAVLQCDLEDILVWEDDGNGDESI